MSQSAFIKLVDGSEAKSLSLDEVKALFETYKEQTSNTGVQLDWGYTDAAFPYTIETKPEGEGKWFYLKGTSDRYKYIVVGVGSEDISDDDDQQLDDDKDSSESESGSESGSDAEDDSEGESEAESPEGNKRHFIQFVLPEGATHGDKAKGNEFVKHFAKKLKAELHLFNGRVMYFNPRK